MSQRQASKAAPRWAEATAIRTLVAPTSRCPETMHQEDFAHREALAGFRSKLAHLIQGHLFVGFVNEMSGATAASVVSHDAIEDNDCAVLTLLERLYQFGRIDRLAHQLDMGTGIGTS